METVKKKILFNKPGGTASKNAMMARLTLPTEFVKALGITQEEKEVHRLYGSAEKLSFGNR